ncbi:MAG: spermidine synthase [Verrucomicrobiia bacterium]
MPSRGLHGAVLTAGFVAMVTQMVLLREVLYFAGGNELSLGLVLGVWMLLMGWGAWLGQRLPVRWQGWGLAFGFALIAALPLPTLGALRVGWAVFVGRGVAAGMSETVGAALLCFAPFCIISGAFLSLAARMEPGREGDGIAGQIGRVYALDCLGGVLGGALFTFVLVHFLDPVQLLGALGIGAGAVAAAVGWGGVGRRLGILPGLLAMLATIPCVEILVSAPGKARERHDTPYGVVEVSTGGGQVALFVDGRPLANGGNFEQVEEAVHPVLAQRPNAERVLLIGGGASGMAAEILRYPVRRLDCVELDASVVDAARRHGLIARERARLRIMIGDARELVKRARAEYDVILVEVPDPSSYQWNRYFTREFFGEAKRAMRKDGVLAVAAGEYANYVSPELANILATLTGTMEAAFSHIVVLPTTRIRTLGSDGPLSTDIVGMVAATGLPMRHLNPAGLRAIFRGERMTQVQGARNVSVPPNLDFHPVLCERFFQDWMKRFRPAPSGLALVALAVLLVGVAMVRRKAFPVMAAGYAGATSQVLVLVGFQVLFGSVYGKVGWLTAVFFGGLGIGAAIGARARGSGPRVALLLLVSTLVAFPSLLVGLGKVDGRGARFAAEWIGVPLLAFVPAMLSAVVLPLAARGDGKARAGDLYHADFAGGCLGALLVSGLLLPWLGLPSAAYIAAAVGLLGTLLTRGR